MKAVLGPTNTGKTHFAIERMIAHKSGMIGLPLRLLAREVYNRIVGEVSKDDVALITGEEKIVPSQARFHVCTMEAMPEKTDVEFVALDEIQLATDIERGHIFTDRLLNLRGTKETMLLGATTLKPILQNLMPDVEIINRDRLSQLNYSGQKKMTRLPPRCAIIAFTANDVYAIAELIRRQRGGACVVLGSLSPRTRNAQVELYQSQEVDFIVATDAIGMGLNLDIDHVAFAQDIKFDGKMRRRLLPHEIAQIAGRAGRHIKNGTFGVTGALEPFDNKLVEQLEAHRFEPIKQIQWRNRELVFDTINELTKSLDRTPSHSLLSKSPLGVDQRSLNALANIAEIKDTLVASEDVKRLWEIAQIPDYRRIAPADHVDILATLYLDLAKNNAINENWFAEQICRCDNISGGIDALSNRIAHIRTWTFVSYKNEWINDALHWQENAKHVEDRLSDALHERLLNRFVDRRTAVLMKRVRENTVLEVEIEKDNINVEGHCIGKLEGFRFTPQRTAMRQDAKTLRLAAIKALAREIDKRAGNLIVAKDEEFDIHSDAVIRWRGDRVARLVADNDVLKPRVVLLADEYLSTAARDKVLERIKGWWQRHCENLMMPLFNLGGETSALGQGLAFRLVENLGIVERRQVAREIHNLSQEQRRPLRELGVRFGAFHIFIPSLLKPAPANLSAMLWALKEKKQDKPDRQEILKLLESGRTCVNVNPKLDKTFYRLFGFLILGKFAIRIDILERLADSIRPLVEWNEGDEYKIGVWSGSGFRMTTDMLSILGAKFDELAIVLKELGYKSKMVQHEEAQEKIKKWNGKESEEVMGDNENNKIAVWYPYKTNKISSAPKSESRSRKRGRTTSGQKGGVKVRNQKSDLDSPFAKLAELKK